MNKEKLGQEPAFPRPIGEYKTVGDGKWSPAQKGMDKRFYAACAAMQGILSNGLANPDKPIRTITIIESAYKFADELLKQENE